MGFFARWALVSSLREFQEMEIVCRIYIILNFHCLQLQNQTVDLVKSLSEENEKCVKLTVQLRMLEECRI